MLCEKRGPCLSDIIQYYIDMRMNLADELADTLRQMVADGALPVGVRINEVELADQLGVSRTPVREGLYRLAADGFVESRPRLGFFVQALDPAMAEQLYGMRAILDPSALELAGVPTPESLERLRAMNAALGDEGRDLEAIIDLDDAWHLELIRACPNAVLVRLIRQFMQRTRPLERAYFRDHQNIDAMMAEHGRIVDRLEEGDLGGAVSALRQNMHSGIGPILRWLNESPPSPEQLRKR